MKRSILALVALFAFSSYASTDVYTCTSSKGMVTVKDHENGRVTVDLTEHKVVMVENAVYVLANTVIDSADFYKDFVLRLSPQTIQKRPGVKLENTSSKFFLKTELDAGIQHCALGINLSKSNGTMKLSYTCSTMFKQYKTLEDSLECMDMEEEE